MAILLATAIVFALFYFFIFRDLSPEEVHAKVSKSSVEIQILTNTGEEVIGTGFFIDDQGNVLTNYHVIMNAKEGGVYVKNVEAFIITEVDAFSEEMDIAAISIIFSSQDYLERSKKDIVSGMNVYAVGSSLGLSDSFSSGIVSYAARTQNQNVFIQTTAPISAGNSGGQLVDGCGAIIGSTSATIAEGQNLNLAIPIQCIYSLKYNNQMDLERFGKISDPNRRSYEKISAEFRDSFATVILNDGTKAVRIFGCSALPKTLQKGCEDFYYGKPLEMFLDLGYVPCEDCLMDESGK